MTCHGRRTDDGRWYGEGEGEDEGERVGQAISERTADEKVSRTTKKKIVQIRTMGARVGLME